MLELLEAEQESESESEGSGDEDMEADDNPAVPAAVVEEPEEGEEIEEPPPIPTPIEPKAVRKQRKPKLEHFISDGDVVEYLQRRGAYIQA